MNTTTSPNTPPPASNFLTKFIEKIAINRNGNYFSEVEEKLKDISWLEKIDLIRFALSNNLKISNEVISFECINVICHEILMNEIDSQ